MEVVLGRVAVMGQKRLRGLRRHHVGVMDLPLCTPRSILSGTTATGSTGTGTVIVSASSASLPLTVNGVPGGSQSTVYNNSFF